MEESQRSEGSERWADHRLPPSLEWSRSRCGAAARQFLARRYRARQCAPPWCGPARHRLQPASADVAW